MSNILTDILGLDSQKKYKENPLAAKDVFVIGDVDVPRMVGISSPIPIKDEKLVTFYDLALSVVGLIEIINTGSGFPLVTAPPLTGSPFRWEVKKLISQDGTIAITDLTVAGSLDFSANFSTDVHPIGFTYDQISHEVTIEQNSPGPIQFLTVDLDNLATEVLDEGAPVETNVTQIDFVGEGVQATSTGTGTVQVNIDGQDIHQLISNNIFYKPLRTPGIGFVPFGQYPPTYNNRLGNDPAIPVISFRIGGDAIDAIGGARLGIGSNDETDWSTNLTDFALSPTGPPGTVQQINATEDQITCAIPIPVDLTTNDKVVVVGTSYLEQDPAIALGQLHVYIAQGTCDDTTNVTLLSEPEDEDSFNYSSFVNQRRGGLTVQSLCFKSEVNLQSAMTPVDDHLIVGFAFSGLNLPLTGVYTDLITINYNVFIIKNPS